MIEENVKINTVHDVSPFIQRVQPVYEQFFQKHEATLPHLPALVERIRKEASL